MKKHNSLYFILNIIFIALFLWFATSLKDYLQNLENQEQALELIREERDVLLKTYNAYLQEISELKTNPDYLEGYMRRNYLLLKGDQSQEMIFIFADIDSSD